jgi:hypothetical protein
MKKEKSDNPDLVGLESNKEEDNLPGYPVYPEDEDIYNNYEEEKDIDPEDIFKKKESIEKIKAKRNPELNFNDEIPGDDLDVPGSELDDDMEIIGSEDEENNFYSLGGDEHDDLDENQEE